MRILSFLLVSFLCANICHSYTVFLLSGKQIYGRLLGEDEITIQLRDSSGIVLSIKKSRVDLDATKRANPIDQPEQPSREVVGQQPSEKTLVEIAQEVRANRSGQARIYTRADLERVPEISVGDQSEDIGFSETNEKSESNLKDDESFWRKSATDFRKELSKLRERKISAQFSCRKAQQKRSASIYGGAKRPSDLSTAFEEPAECERLKAIQSQLEDAEWRWEEFTERARRAEVPWSWIE